MTKIKMVKFRQFGGLFVKLLEYKCFADFLKSLPIQTDLMTQKQVLRVPYKYDPNRTDILKISSNNTMYVDRDFYQSKMGEILQSKNVKRSLFDFELGSNKSFPVVIKSLRIDWIINTPMGQEYLTALLESENLNLFGLEANKMIITFLYKRYRKFMTNLHLPVFAANMICLLAMLIL